MDALTPAPKREGDPTAAAFSADREWEYYQIFSRPDDNRDWRVKIALKEKDGTERDDWTLSAFLDRAGRRGWELILAVPTWFYTTGAINSTLKEDFKFGPQSSETSGQFDFALRPQELMLLFKRPVNRDPS